MSALPDFKEPDVISATPDDVVDVLLRPASWDGDQHDRLWWTKRIDDAGFFENWRDLDKAEILTALMRDCTPWTADMRHRLRAVIEQEIAT